MVSGPAHKDVTASHLEPRPALRPHTARVATVDDARGEEVELQGGPDDQACTGGAHDRHVAHRGRPRLNQQTDARGVGHEVLDAEVHDPAAVSQTDHRRPTAAPHMVVDLLPPAALPRRRPGLNRISLARPRRAAAAAHRRRSPAGPRAGARAATARAGGGSSGHAVRVVGCPIGAEGERLGRFPLAAVGGDPDDAVGGHAVAAESDAVYLEEEPAGPDGVYTGPDQNQSALPRRRQRLLQPASRSTPVLFDGSV